MSSWFQLANEQRISVGQWAAEWAADISLELLHGEIPSRVDLHEFHHQKGHRQTDRPTDMCNPTDAIASKNIKKKGVKSKNNVNLSPLWLKCGPSDPFVPRSDLAKIINQSRPRDLTQAKLKHFAPSQHLEQRVITVHGNQQFRHSQRDLYFSCN